jgi:hypothetical protein
MSLSVPLGAVADAATAWCKHAGRATGIPDWRVAEQLTLDTATCPAAAAAAASEAHPTLAAPPPLMLLPLLLLRP